MTSEEALKHIKPRLKLYIQCTDDNFALHKAVEALEKQIPKKAIPHKTDIPIYIGNGTWGKGTTVYKCPNCKSHIAGAYKHCTNCGQALDWSEEDEK